MPDTSTFRPTSTNVEMPTPRRRAPSSAAMPSVPDWVKKPTCPGITSTPANVAFIDTPHCGVDHPERLRADQPHAPPAGEDHQAVGRVTLSTSPGGPNPALVTTSPRTRRRAHSTTTASVNVGGDGTARRDRSRRERRGWTGQRPHPGHVATVGVHRVDGATEVRAAAGSRTVLVADARPTRAAPITAIEPGDRMRATERASDRRARSSMRAWGLGVRLDAEPHVDARRPRTSSAHLEAHDGRSTLSILRLVGSTMATSDGQTCLACGDGQVLEQDSVATPRPWWCVDRS